MIFKKKIQEISTKIILIFCSKLKDRSYRKSHFNFDFNHFGFLSLLFMNLLSNVFKRFFSCLMYRLLNNGKLLGMILFLFIKQPSLSASTANPIKTLN